MINGIKFTIRVISNKFQRTTVTKEEIFDDFRTNHYMGTSQHGPYFGLRVGQLAVLSKTIGLQPNKTKGT